MIITQKDFANFRKEADRKIKIKTNNLLNNLLNLISDNKLKEIKEIQESYDYFNTKEKLNFIKKSINNSEIFEYFIIKLCDFSIYEDILKICLKNNKFNGIDRLYEIHKLEGTEKEFYEMVMCEAAYSNNLEMIQHCLEKDKKINIKNAINVCVEYKKFETFDYLIKLNKLSSSKNKLLEKAFQKLRNEDYRFIVEIIKLNKGIDENLKETFFYYSPKPTKAFNRYLKEIEPFVLNDEILKGSLFLEYTRRNKLKEVIEMLKNGIDPNIKGFNHTKETPIEIAINNKNVKLIKELIDYGAKIKNWEEIKRWKDQEIVKFIDEYPRFSKLNKELQKIKKKKPATLERKLKI